MKRGHCALFIALLTQSRALAQGPACSGSIDVHVIDALLHTPVADAYVAVNEAGAGVTDQRGHLTLGGLCAGDHVIDVVHPGYEEVRRSVSLVRAASVEIELPALVERVTVVEKAVAPADMRSTAVLSGEALDRKRGQSLSETLSEVPGVSQLRSGTGMAKPIVRGHFGRRVPLLVDGVRHRAQDWGLDHAPEIDPAIADRITVVRGASGVRYGSDAIGGVVLVDPPPMLTRPGFSSESHLIGYANGLGGGVMGRIQLAPVATPGLALQLEGSAKRVQAPSTPDYPLDNTAEAEWSAGVSATYRGAGGVYQLSFRHFQTELGVCTCYSVDSASDFFAQLGRGRPLGSELYSADFAIGRPYQSVAHELALARARWTIGSLGTVTGTYALQYDDRREFDVVRRATKGPQFSFQLWTHDSEVVLEHTPIHLTEHLHLSGSAGAVGMLQSHAYSGLPLVPDHQGGGTGVYLTERLWGHDHEIEAGVRYDYLSRRASILGRDFSRLVRSGQLTQNTCGIPGADGDPVTCASAFHTVSASLGGLVRFTPSWSGKLDLSTASRPPNPDEQYLNGSSPSFPVVGLGQPDASAETSYSASATVSYSGRRVAAEVSAFGNYVADYLYFSPAMGPDGQPVFDILIRGAFPRFVTRGIDALFYGADGTVSVAPATWLELGAQASAVRARNLADASYLAFVPQDRLRSSVTVTKNSFLGLERATATFAGTYAARQSRFDVTADLAPPPDGYFLAEASLGAETRAADHTVKVALQGQNIFGARYREYASLLRYFADQPGRQLMLRITMLYRASKQSP